MNIKGKILPIFIIIPFVLGIILDRFLKDFPYLELDPKINFLSLANLIVAIVIAFLIPFTVKKYIEDEKDIKSFLVDELKELISIVNCIKSIISDAHSNGSFSNNNRDCIIYKFHEAELKVNSIREQVKIAFESKSVEVEKNLSESLSKYDDYITGGELMNSSFVKVDERFFKESNVEYSKIETSLKKLIHKVYKF